MADDYSRTRERFVMIGGYLFGAIAGVIIPTLCLIPLVFVLWYFIFMLIPVIPFVSFAEGAWSAEVTRRQLWHTGKIPATSIAGYVLLLLCIPAAIWYRSAYPPNPEYNSPNVLLFLLVFLNVHLGELWGGMLSSEIMTRKAPGQQTSLPYPIWGYITGLVTAIICTSLLAPLTADSGNIGVFYGSGFVLLIVSLVVFLISRFVPTAPANNAAPIPPPLPARSASSLAYGVLILLTIAASIFILFAVRTNQTPPAPAVRNTPPPSIPIPAPRVSKSPSTPPYPGMSGSPLMSQQRSPLQKTSRSASDTAYQPPPTEFNDDRYRQLQEQYRIAEEELPSLLGPLFYPNARLVSNPQKSDVLPYPQVALETEDSLETVIDYYQQQIPDGKRENEEYLAVSTRPGDGRRTSIYVHPRNGKVSIGLSSQ